MAKMASAARRNDRAALSLKALRPAAETGNDRAVSPWLAHDVEPDGLLKMLA
jgi:hypothetical protein